MAAKKAPQRNGKRSGGKPAQDKRTPKPTEGKQQRGSGRSRAKAHGASASREDLCLLEGRHAFEEAHATEAPIEELLVSASIMRDERMERLLRQACEQGAKLKAAAPEELDAFSSHGAHQGVIARLKPYSYTSAKQLAQAAAGAENALIVACDHVTDAGNFGAIVRTAEVVGAAGVLIPNKRSARVNTAAYKTSAGAVLHLPIAMESNLVRSLEALKDEGFWVVGASEHAQDVLWDAPLSGRIVLVMGSEDTGLGRLVLETCDLLVKLPQAGKVESLNVAQAATALCYEWVRQCRAKGAGA